MLHILLFKGGASPSASLVLENIGVVYPSMSMIVIGHSLLYKDKDGAVWCMMFIDSLGDDG
jgi:hypothetical protein